MGAVETGVTRPALPSSTASRTRRVLLALGLVAIIVLAGCSAPSVSLDEAERPPGVRENRVVPEPLIAAHTSALADESYTTRFEYSGPRRNVSGVFRVGPDHEHARVVYRFDDADESRVMRLYVGDEHVYVRERVEDGDVRYRVTEKANWTVRHLRNDLGMLAPTKDILREVSLEPTGTTAEDGRTLVVLQGNGTALAPFHQYQPVEARLAVSERGVVHRAEFTGQQPEGHSTWRLTELGQTTVSRPEWVETAIENSTQR